MNSKDRITSSLLILCLAAVACNLPGGAATETPTLEASPTFTPVFLETASPIPIPTECSPIITTNTDANVRNGPGTIYSIAGQIPTGGTAPVQGRNADGTWWYIVFAGGNGGFGWIAGSITTATCIPATLPIIAAPPTPVIPPTNTPTPSNTAAPTNTPSPTATSTLFIPVFPTFGLPCIPAPPFITCP